MTVKPIRSDDDLRAAFKQLEQVFQAPVGSPQADDREMLVTLIEAYEQKHYPIGPADPVEVIKFRMEQQNLTPKDLEPYIGSSGRVSEVLNLKLMKNLLSLTLLAAALPFAATSHAADATLEAAAKEAGAVVTASGLVYKSVKDGNGTSPKASDTVKVNYLGTFPDGKEFDSSFKRNKAIEFPLANVIPCWTEGVQRMKVGGKARLTCPASIAYGSRGAGGVIPPNATLLFEVELLAINGK